MGILPKRVFKCIWRLIAVFRVWRVEFLSLLGSEFDHAAMSILPSRGISTSLCQKKARRVTGEVS